MPIPSDNPLTFRTTDMTRWGVGKGARLTSGEVDLNFWEVLLLIAELQANAAVPAEIANIAVSNGQMTITLTNDVVFGPFDLPQQAFRWVDEFVGGSDYEMFDVFTKNNSVYLVLQAHTADMTFDPAAVNLSGPLYGLMMTGQIYDVGFYWPGRVGAGLDADECMFSHLFARDAYLPADLVGSLAKFEVAPADEIFVVDIYKNDELIGNYSHDAGSSSDDPGVFSFLDDVQFSAGDRLRVIRPASGSDTTLDSAARGFNLTIAAIRGTI